MIRKNLVRWQWSDYDTKHRHRTNLWIHFFAIPLFWIGALFVIAGFYGVGHFFVGLSFCLLSFILQAVGHKLESETPTPFLHFGDFVSRFLVEQFVNFPRFLFAGHWKKNLKG